MAKYRYIVEQAKRFDDDANDRKVIDLWHVVGHDMEVDWDSATSTEPGEEEYNAEVIGDVVDDSVDLNITGGQFTISDGTKIATVYLDGDEQNLVDMMDKIDDAFVASEMSMKVEAFVVEWPEENKSYLKITSTGEPGTSDNITISTTTAVLSEFGLSSGTTNGTKPDRTIVNKKYLGGIVVSTEEIDNPIKPRITLHDKFTSEELDRLFRSRVVQGGHVDESSIPLTVEKENHNYIETEFDEVEDGEPITNLLSDTTSGHHLYKVEKVCKEFDATSGECVSSRFEPVETSSGERNAEDYYSQKYVELILERSKAFAMQLASDFTRENIQMGITEAGESNNVRKALKEVWNCLETGSLHAAIEEAELVERSDPFLSEARIRSFINRIKDFLGISY